MKLLLLGPYCRNFQDFLMSFGDEIISTDEKLSPKSGILKDVDFIISYGYRHILKNEILDLFPGKAINLHISLLPWNRGADPNLWSFLEDTPKGVTIHKLDYGVDTGDIIAQEELNFDLDDTLRTAYHKLSESIERLFKKIWPDIRQGKVKASPQSWEGTLHHLKDREAYDHLLTQGWDTPVVRLIGKGICSSNGKE